jgi:PST family polysaccharide transporter
MTSTGERATPSDILALGSVQAELRTRSVRSGLIAAAGRITQGVIGLGSVAVLARVLTPSEFGVVAMVTPVTTMVSMTMHRGLHYALLHEDELTSRQVSQLYWLAQRHNLGLVTIMALLGPVLAWVYQEPRVTLVAIIWAASTGVQGMGTMFESLLKRQLRFGALTMVNVLGMLLGTLVAIASANAGARHVALVMQFVVWDLVRFLGAIMLCRWRPGRLDWSTPTDPVVVRLVTYGGHFTLHRAVYWAGRQTDRILVGIIGGAGSLGIYDGARRWSWYAFHELFQSVTDVVIASLSRARRDIERFREFARHGMMAFLIAPLGAIAFVFVESEAAVRVLLGDRWLDAIPLVRIMCAAAFCDSLSRLTMWIYTVEGRTRQQFYWSLVVTPIMLVALAVGARLNGVTGVAWAFAGFTIAFMVPTIVFCLRGSALGPSDMVALAWRPVLTALVAASLIMITREWLPGVRTQLPGLLASAAAYSVFYIVTWLALPGGISVTRSLRISIAEAFARRTS